MKKSAFNDLLASVHEALAHAQGKLDLRTTVLPSPPVPLGAADVRQLRDSLNMSQAVFAMHLNVSTKLVQAWEAGRRAPEGAALRLLHVVAQYPAAVLGDQRGSRHVPQRTGNSSRPPAPVTRRKRGTSTVA